MGLLIITVLSQTELSIANTTLIEGSAEGRYHTNQTNSTLSGFNFAAAGDWGCNEMTQRTVNNMRNKDPEVVLGLGDFSYQRDTGCWFKIMSSLLNKTKIVIGEHDYDTNNNSRLQDYVNKFNLSDPYYSFNYRNIHFLAMSSVIPFSNESLPFKLLQDDSKQK